MEQLIVFNGVLVLLTTGQSLSEVQSFHNDADVVISVTQCPRCFGRQWLFMGPHADLVPCPDCERNPGLRGTARSGFGQLTRRDRVTYGDSFLVPGELRRLDQVPETLAPRPGFPGTHFG